MTAVPELEERQLHFQHNTPDKQIKPRPNVLDNGVEIKQVLATLKGVNDKMADSNSAGTLHLIHHQRILCSHLDISCKVIPMSYTAKANSMAVTAKENRMGSV